MFLFYAVIVCFHYSLAIFQICVSIQIKVYKIYTLSSRISIMHVFMLNENKQVACLIRVKDKEFDEMIFRNFELNDEISF